MLSLGLLISCSHKPTTPEGANPCFVMIVEGKTKELQENLVECKKANNRHATSLLMFAASREQIPAMELLLQDGADLDEYDFNGDTALFYAASTRKNKAIEWLLQKGASPKSFRKDGISPLMISINNGNEESWNLFLSAQGQIDDLNTANEDGWTPLFFAVRKENLKLVEKLLSLGAETQILSKENDTPLTLADEQQWKDGIKLIKKYAEKNKKPKK